MGMIEAIINLNDGKMVQSDNLRLHFDANRGEYVLSIMYENTPSMTLGISPYVLSHTIKFVSELLGKPLHWSVIGDE